MKKKKNLGVIALSGKQIVINVRRAAGRDSKSGREVGGDGGRNFVRGELGKTERRA